MCKNAQSINVGKDWSPDWLYSHSSFEHTCKQQLWNNFKQKKYNWVFTDISSTTILIGKRQETKSLANLLFWKDVTYKQT